MSEWVGKVGEHIARDVTVKGYIWRPSWGDVPKLFLLEDNSGNVLTIRSKSKFRVGQKWTVDGLVKKHCRFNGQRQTFISEWGLMLR